MSTNPSDVMIEVPVRRFLQLTSKSVPQDLQHDFQIYQAHFGRGDFGSCGAIAARVLSVEKDVEPDRFKSVYQAFSWHSKIGSDALTREQRERALVKFHRMETRCKLTNKRLAFYGNRPFTTDRKVGVENFWTKLRSEVAKIIGGPLTTARYVKMAQSVRFGPGMTLSSECPKRTGIPYKLIDIPTATRSAIPVWRDFIAGTGVAHGWWDYGSLGWCSPRVKNVSGNRIVFVPKDSTIARVIAIEPSANVVCQLSIHDDWALRLEQAGNSITDQNRNRGMALSSSLTGRYATVDLSSASDTVAYELVRLVFHSSWFKLLGALRSPVGDVGGETVSFEKFSSMGNGFTFALETVLFLAICRVVSGSRDCSAYGDDLIVPVESAPKLLKVLRFLGFLPNKEKTFVDGHFRESCGLDAYKGVDVRPCFVRATKLGLVEAYSLHNQLLQKGLPEHALALANAIPKSLRRYGPPTVHGDGVLKTEDTTLYEVVLRPATQSFVVPGFRAKAVKEKLRADLLLKAAVLSGGQWSQGATLRGATKIVACELPT